MLSKTTGTSGQNVRNGVKIGWFDDGEKKDFEEVKIEPGTILLLPGLEVERGTPALSGDDADRSSAVKPPRTPQAAALSEEGELSSRPEQQHHLLFRGALRSGLAKLDPSRSPSPRSPPAAVARGSCLTHTFARSVTA